MGGGFGGQQQQGGFGGGFGNTFARTMPPQQGFGGGFGGQQGGFGNVARPHVMPRQQQQGGFGGGFGGQQGFGGGFGMPQQRQQPPMLQPGSVSNISAGGLSREYLDRMRAAESQPQRLNGPSTDMNTVMDPFRQQVNQMMQQRGIGGGSQPVLGTPGGNLVGGMDPRMLRPNVNRPLPQQQMPPNPYAQQVRQEDPRMQAMRMMQRMNFGGGGGYNF